MPQTSQISQISFNPLVSSTYVASFIASLRQVKKYKNLGRLIILIEIEKPKKKSKKLAKEIIKTLQKLYYCPFYTSQEDALEATGKKFNEQIFLLKKEEKNQIKKEVHLLIASFKDNNFILTGDGIIKAFFLRGQELSNIFGALQTINQEKKFTSIFSGKLQNKDKLCFFTYSLTLFLPLDELKEKLINLSPENFIRYLEGKFSHENPRSTGAIVFQSNIKEEFLKEESLSVTLEEKPRAQIEIEKEKASQEKKQNKQIQEKQIQEKLKLVGEILKKILRQGAEDLKLVAELFKHFKSFPFASKLFLAAFLILVVFISSTLIWGMGSKSSLETFQKDDKILLEILEKEKLAESEWSLKNEEKARSYLLEAETLFLKLSPALKEKREKLFKFVKEGLKNQEEKINQAYYIQEPQVLIDFSLNIKNSPKKVDKMILLPDGRVIIFNTNSNILYEANLTEETLIFHSNNLSEGYFQKATLASPDSIVLLTDGGEIVRFDTTEQKFHLVRIPEIVAQNKKADLSIYADRLYILEPRSRQIYRFEFEEDELSSKFSWLKDKNVDLSEATSLTVDGSIYVAKENGEILKLERGEAQKFSLSSLAVPLGHLKKIFTTPTSDLLYVLDPENKRVVCFLKKDGRLQAQYISKTFDDLKDFALNSEKNEIYLLNGTKIYKINF